MIKRLLIFVAIAGFLASCGGTDEKKDDAKQKRIEFVKKRIEFYRSISKTIFFNINYCLMTFVHLH